MSTKSRPRRHVLPLSGDDEIDVALETRDGRVSGFAVNYRARWGSEWHEVIRYDTHHGRLHVHRFWRGPGRTIEFLERPGEGTQDHRERLQAAVDDIRQNWRAYRARLREARGEPGGEGDGT